MSSIKDHYLETVLNEVRFPFDRKQIRKELEAHLEESIEGHMKPTMTLEAAETKAIQEFGDPKQIGKLLNKVHKPFLGWLWILSRTTLIGLLIVAALFSVSRLYDNWMRSQGVKAPTQEASVFVDAVGIQNGNVILDQVLNQSVELNDATIRFERVILLDNGIIILLTQQIDSFNLFGLKPTEYPLRTQGTLNIGNTSISFRQSGVMGFSGHVLLVADGIIEVPETLVFDFYGYSETFSLALELNHD